MAGHGTEAAHVVRQMAVCELGGAVAGVESADGFGLSHGGSGSLLGFVSAESALHGIFGGDGEGLLIVFVLDEIGLVIRDVRAMMLAIVADGTRHDEFEGLFQKFMVGSEFLSDLAGGGVDADAIAGVEGVEEFESGGADEEGVGHFEMKIVEEKRDEALRQVGRGGGCVVVDGVIGSGDYGDSVGVRFFDAEGRDVLRLAIVEELEIFFFEIFDYVALRVANDYADGNEINANFESGGGIAGDDLGAGGRGRLRFVG